VLALHHPAAAAAAPSQTEKTVVPAVEPFVLDQVQREVLQVQVQPVKAMTAAQELTTEAAAAAALVRLAVFRLMQLMAGLEALVYKMQ
jgi:hypothetical protein